MKQPAKSTPFVYLCPQCGELLYYRLRARDTHYGAPLRPCPHCGATYFDPSYREPALEKRPRLPLLPGTVWGGLLLGLAFLLGAAFLPQKLELAVMGVLFFGASLWYAVDWRRTAPQRQADFEREQAESRGLPCGGGAAHRLPGGSVFLRFRLVGG